MVYVSFPNTACFAGGEPGIVAVVKPCEHYETARALATRALATWLQRVTAEYHRASAVLRAAVMFGAEGLPPPDPAAMAAPLADVAAGRCQGVEEVIGEIK